MESMESITNITTITEKGYAKINIGLDVLRKREDGYHEVRMIMQTIDVFDLLTITKTQIPGIALKVNVPGLEADERNLAYKAAKIILDTKYKDAQPSFGLAIELEKNIPMAAGLAGGSADAAAVLRGVNKLCNMGYDTEALMKLGVKLGADVPYCVMEGTALAEGIGEKLSLLPPCPDCYVLIAKPPIDVSTAFVYGNLHANELKVHADIDGLIDCITKKELKKMAQNMGNVLETVTIPAYPVIDTLKNMMVSLGALGSMMSGSGPTVFGIFEKQEQALAAQAAIDKTSIGAQTAVASLHR